MNFKEATDRLAGCVGHTDIAAALGVSTQLVRQARLAPEAQGYRTPPEGWHGTLIRLAEERVWHYRQLITSLRNGGET